MRKLRTSCFIRLIIKFNPSAKMKNWALVATVFVLGTFILTPLAHSEPRMSPRTKALPFQGSGGRDISEDGWQNWQAPVGTVDPEQLISDDSTNSTVDASLPKIHSGSFQVAGGKPIQIEASKPIEMVANGNNPAIDRPAPVLVTATPKPKSDSKRIILVAVISVAVLSYRKFRRANATPYPPKPNFL